MAKRLKVGVVGAGVIAQVMHLNYLRELVRPLRNRCTVRYLGGERRQQRRPVQHPEEVHRLAGDDRRRRHRRRLHPDLGQSRADRRRGGECGQARPGREADVLLRRRRSGDEGRGRRGRGDVDGRVPETLRPGIRAFPGCRGEGRGATTHAGHHVRVAVPSRTSATTRWHPSRRSRRMRSRTSPRRPRPASPVRSARRIPSCARNTTWCCWTPWFTNSTPCVVCSVSRPAWSTSTCSPVS